MFVEINGNRLNVELLGPEDGPVLIAHHGGGGVGSLEGPRSMFGPLADRLRLVVFDARGCGRSEGTPPFTHEQWAADVEGLRRWLGAERIMVGGASYGGYIAMEYAIRHPDRVQAMILCGTAADGSHVELAFENARRQDRVAIDWNDFERYWGGRIRDDEDLKACLAGIMPLYDHDYDPARARARIEGGFYRHETHNQCVSSNLPAYDVRADLPALTCPTLMMVGRDDWVTPVSCAEEIAALLPDAELVVFERSGHSPHIEEPDAFRRVLNGFVDRILAPTATAAAAPAR